LTEERDTAVAEQPFHFTVDLHEAQIRTNLPQNVKNCVADDGEPASATCPRPVPVEIARQHASHAR